MKNYILVSLFVALCLSPIKAHCRLAQLGPTVLVSPVQKEVKVWKQSLASFPDPQINYHSDAFVNLTNQQAHSFFSVKQEVIADQIDFFFLVVSVDYFYEAALTSPGAFFVEPIFVDYWQTPDLNQTLFVSLPWTLEELNQMDYQLSKKEDFIELLSSNPPADDIVYLKKNNAINIQLIAFQNTQFRGLIQLKGLQESNTQNELWDPSKVSLLIWYLEN